MSVQHLLITTAADLLGGVGIATPAVTGVLAQATPVDSYTLTPGRLGATVSALVALAGVAAGGLALIRSARRVGANGTRGAVVALVAGLAGMAGGGLVVAAAEGGPGTGYGIVGGVAALAFGLIATVLGGLTLARARRIA